ncbi:E1 protein [Bos taurus papillomavirus 18]|uniref:Replication protein E1 n=1 Tax=Bos taurus papillomavirus 18 TaxID=1887216 RepID=A0A1B2K230_9PAPI|nr:E1 protein [Bos taurus papillomavirus 18]ANZ90246.1 E1 protein [Bos taurus papillomavirus 18]
MANQGINGDWFIVRESDVNNSDENVDESEEISADSEFSDLSNLIDDALVEQGNSRELFHQQEGEQHQQELAVLKRKYLGSPEERLEIEISPRLANIEISPRSQKAKRRLFDPQNDSGVDLSGQNEASSYIEEPPSQVAPQDSVDSVVQEHNNSYLLDILKSSNRRATQLARFKHITGISFTELTRAFKNDQTCAGYWVIAVFNVIENLYEAFKTLFIQHCDYYNMCLHMHESGLLCLVLVSFKANKSRKTVINLVKTLLQVEDYQILTQPPKLRSIPACLYWFKRAFNPATTIYGEMPEWLRKATAVGYQTEEETTFSLADMIQWAYDNNHLTEPAIAYEYARSADEDRNARAWLNSNNQAKHVKDCCRMVNLYKVAEMKEMTVSAWINKRCKMYDGQGNWKIICEFLKFQQVSIPNFLETLKLLLKNIPKKSCMVIYGPSDTGKSMLAHSFIRFMGGSVLSYTNHNSQFWLMPLAKCKVALIDDATKPCWDYININMRNALDGNDICVDLKHKNPQQITCPPLLITTNENLLEDDKWRFLRSRLAFVHFPNKIVNADGGLLFNLNELNWKFFFERLWTTLELSDQEEEDGNSSQPFRCGSRRTADSV